MLAGPLRAQVPDSTRTDTTQVDSVQTAPPDSTRAPGQEQPAQQEEPFTPLPFLTAPRGAPVLDVLPIRHPAPDIAHLLAQAPSSFLFDLGANGWPHGWSREGLPPHRPSLLFDGHPYDDPVTGRPRFDLLPPEFLRPPRVGTDRLGGPVGVYVQPHIYDVEQPLTELRYRRDNAGMQSIAVAHAQQRRIALMGDAGLLQLVGGYYGRAANDDDDAYPNSDLRRERRHLAQVRYRQRRWSATLRNLHSRRQIGAHGGVIPQGPFLTVYNRLIAQVRNPNARRRTIRNDLALTVRAPLLSGLAAPLTASTNWTAQTFWYRDQSDTLEVKTNSYHGYLRQDVALGRHTLFFEIGATLDRVRETNAWAGRDARRRLHATLRDSIALDATTLVLDGGLHAADGQVYPSATAHVTQRWGSARLFAEAGLAGQTASRIEEMGFGPFVQPLDDAPIERTLHGRAGIHVPFGAFDAQLTGFAHEVRNPIDLYATQVPDSLLARAGPQPLQRAGLTAQLGWRRGAEAGLYATGQATALQLLNPRAASENARVADVLPTLFGQGRLGARFVTFAGDLDADLYVQGRAWTAMRSRQFHPPTGLLAVPLPGAPVMEGVPLSFGPMGTFDVTLEAGIRDATLFFTFENLLSGTTLQPGIIVVPVYPLPDRRFRFGVFWPIWN